ncbi:MAG: tripartite tricarboxylate transporter substrate binding protein [Betaproteobacteria bacterium]|nr:MAG: tripartite tricarboxylate transporter substrate binding protein [Betaproteobacteria bacterium]
MIHSIIRVLAGAVAVCCANAVAAQDYPSRPVRMIVPFAAGGPTDVIARIVAQKLTEGFGHQVVVDNRAGAGGNIGMGLAATSQPDGHTMIVVSSSFVVNPGLYKSIPYDPYKSFAPVSNMAASPNVFTVHPSIAAKSMKELLTLVAADPKKFSVATPGVGTTPDLSAQLLKLTTKLDFITVPFGGAGPAVGAVVGNQVQIGCTALPPTTPHIKAGRLRAIAVTSPKRSGAIADVPTLAEVGFKGQEADTLQGLLLPAGTSKAIIGKLHGQVVKMMAQPEVKSRIEGLGFDIIGSSPAEFTAQIKVEVEKWTKVVRAAGIQVN